MPEFSGPSPNTLDAIAGGAADEVFEFERRDGGQELRHCALWGSGKQVDKGRLAGD